MPRLVPKIYSKMEGNGSEYSPPASLVRNEAPPSMADCRSRRQRWWWWWDCKPGCGDRRYKNGNSDVLDIGNDSVLAGAGGIMRVHYFVQVMKPLRE